MHTHTCQFLPGLALIAVTSFAEAQSPSFFFFAMLASVANDTVSGPTSYPFHRKRVLGVGFLLGDSATFSCAKQVCAVKVLHPRIVMWNTVHDTLTIQ